MTWFYNSIDANSVKLTEYGEELLFIERGKWTTIPMTSGIEIEQKDRDICYRLRDKYEWHYDGSGPLETALEPSITPLTKIKEFIDFVLDNNCEWEWKGFYYSVFCSNDPVRYCGNTDCENGCGSHIHLRPRPSELHKQNPKYSNFYGINKDPPYPHPETVSLEEVWATAYNTLVDLVPFIFPLFVYGNKNAPLYKPRVSITYWADLSPTRYSPETFYNTFMRPDYYGHPYGAIALNRKTEDKPLTIELRLNETHPAISYFIIIIINRIVRKVFDRGYSSVRLDMGQNERTAFYSTIREAISKSGRCQTDIYTALEEAFENYVQNHGPVRFEQGREIPGCRREYNSYFRLFKDILHANSNWLNPVEERIYRLFAMKGNPAKNCSMLWRIFRIPKGEFCWEEPEWCEKE
jgi:hypothetical protein